MANEDSASDILSPESDMLKSASENLEFHPNLCHALSPSSGFHIVLWPIIVHNSSWVTRGRILRNVNHYLRRLCHEYRYSDRAKATYFKRWGNVRSRNNKLPYVLDLSTDVEWRCWGADKAGFGNINNFREFCAIGGVDPECGMRWCPYVRDGRDETEYDIKTSIWMSKNKDIVFETSRDPLDPQNDGYCHYLGLHGRADKAIAMMDYLCDKEKVRDPPTIWEETAHSRQWI